MIVQMIAFGRISDLREKRRESKSRKQKRTVLFKPDTNKDKRNDIRTTQAMSVKDMPDGKSAHQEDEPKREHSETEHPSSGTNSESEETDRTTDSEVIL